MDDFVPVELSRVVLQHKSEQQYIHLRDPATDRSFPIVIGLYEAAEINRKLHAERLERPMTWDLIGRILDATDWQLARVAVTELREHTFYACLVLVRDGDEKIVDCRPSDAIALSVQLRVPVFVARDVLDALCPE